MGKNDVERLRALWSGARCMPQATQEQKQDYFAQLVAVKRLARSWSPGMDVLLRGGADLGDILTLLEEIVK